MASSMLHRPLAGCGLPMRSAAKTMPKLSPLVRAAPAPARLGPQVRPRGMALR
jgi:hypothetical protein